MISDAALQNVVVYSAQLAVIIALASVLPRLLRLDNPGVRYAYWRAVALLCLALPAVQPYQRLVSGRQEALVDAAVTDVAAVSMARAAGPARMDWLVLAFGVVVLGAVARLAWLGFGLWKLQRLRASASAEPCVADDDLQHTLGTRAEIRFA